MSPAQPPIHVVHKPNLHRFEADIEGSIAVLEYSFQNGSVSFNHTYVPDNLRGLGIAAALAKEAFAEARRQKWHVIPACTYIAAYLRRHPN